jgi:predicted nucleotidyltransferase component of viral defense system
MIPRATIAEWRHQAPWQSPLQVEQDLIISRALVEIFNIKEIRDTLCFRGGTALFKLFLPPIRYSEDIDLVQVRPGRVGPLFDAARKVLDPWLGEPKRKIKQGRVDLIYRMLSEDEPPLPMRLKIEINSLEHFSVFEPIEKNFEVSSRWFEGSSMIRTYQLDEMLGTKLRALYQRRKGRDLFDLWMGLRQSGVNHDRVVECFNRYLKHDRKRVSRAEFEKNLAGKMQNQDFCQDVNPLLVEGTEYNTDEAYSYLLANLISKLPGEPWKGSNVK